MDDFEQFLKSQPMRAVPPQWRGEVLAEARKEKTPMAGWRGWLWPSPYAWGALAATWLVIFVLNSAAEPERNRMVATGPAPTSQELVALLNERRKQLEEFLPTTRVVVAAPPVALPAAKPGAYLERHDAEKLFHV